MTRRIMPIVPSLLLAALRGEIENPLAGFPPDGRITHAFWNSYLHTIDTFVESADFVEAEATLPLFVTISGETI